MGKFFFTKMEGAGNDFILFDLFTYPHIKFDENSVKKICDRRRGIGADGLICIAPSDKADFEMHYFNADGLEGSLCGNGSRCIVMYAYNRHRVKNRKVSFVFNGESYSAEVIDDTSVKFYLNEPKELKKDQTLKIDNKIFAYSFIDTGSPHVVIQTEEDIGGIDVFQLGRKIRYAGKFKPEGANVNFVQYKNGEVLIRTYERGVENETLACGTGSVASALISFIREKVKPPVHLITKSGERLVVDFEFKDQKIKNLTLVGPAKTTFTGEVDNNKYFFNTES